MIYIYLYIYHIYIYTHVYINVYMRCAAAAAWTSSPNAGRVGSIDNLRHALSFPLVQ